MVQSSGFLIFFWVVEGVTLQWNLFLLFLKFLLCHAQDPTSQPEIEPRPVAVKSRSPNCWTVRDFPSEPSYVKEKLWRFLSWGRGGAVCRSPELSLLSGHLTNPCTTGVSFWGTHRSSFITTVMVKTFYIWEYKGEREASQVDLVVKNLLANAGAAREPRSLGWENSLEDGMASPASILA